MGMFSWDCPACEISARSHHATDRQDHIEVTLINKMSIISGNYDGYGGINSDEGYFDITVLSYLKGDVEKYRRIRDLKKMIKNAGDAYYFSSKRFDIKLYHTKCYKGQSFKKCKVSIDSDDQGFFF